MNIKDAYDVIIVGGGVSGLTAAAYLSKYGYRILLCEQNENTGGLVSSFQHHGFVFDGGIRAFEDSGIVFPMLRQLGIEMEFVKNPVTIGIGNELIQLDSKDSLYDYEILLNKHFPSDREDIGKIIKEIEVVMDYMDVIYGIENPLFTDYKKDKEYLVKTLLPWLMKYKKNIKKATKLNEPINDYLLRFTKNQSLIDMITQHFFQNTPTFFALSYFGLYLDYNYSIGGTGVLSEKLTDFIQEHHGNIVTNTKISVIHMDENQVNTTDGRNFTYKKLIWACDAKSLYNGLKSNDRKGRGIIESQSKLAHSHVGGDSILTLYLGIDLDQEYFKNICGPHCFYTPNTMGISTSKFKQRKERNTKSEWMNQVIEYLSYTTYEISCPVIRDLSLAPEGNSGLIISTLMDYSFMKEIYEIGCYEVCKELCIDTILQVLDDTLFPGIKSKVLFRLCSTPLTIENMTGNAEGAITGWAFTDGKMPSETRFQKIIKSVDTRLQDIYQVGQWSFSPSGLPTCILTGKVAADGIDKKLRKTK